MGKGGLILLGAVVFLLGLLLRSGLVEWLLNLLGILAMVAGVVILSVGVWSAIRGRR